MSTITISTELVTETCKTCSGLFAITKEFKQECHRIGGFRQMWACPYCKTTWGYGESEETRLKLQIAARETEADAIRRDLTAAKCSLIDERSARAQAERKCRRITKRIHAGVCPCCNRTFSNLARHMSTKHPENVPSISIATG